MMENEKLKLWLNFSRFVLGSVVVTLVSTILNYQIQQTRLDMDAQSMEDSYIQTHLTSYMASGDKERTVFVNFLRFVTTEERKDNYEKLYKSLVDEIALNEQKVKLEKEGIARFEADKKKASDSIQAGKKKAADLRRKAQSPGISPADKEAINAELKKQLALINATRLDSQRYEKIIQEKKDITESLQKDISNPNMSAANAFVPINLDLKRGESFLIKDLDVTLEATRVNSVFNKATIWIKTGEEDNNPSYVLGINKYAIFSKAGVDYKLLVTNVYNEEGLNQSHVEMTLSRVK